MTPKASSASSADTPASGFPTSQEARAANHARVLRGSGNVLIANFITSFPELAAGTREISDYVASIKQSHPERAALMAEARRNLAASENGTLRSLRMKSGLSQAELAERIGTTQSAIARIEAGREDPTITRGGKIADALGVTLDEFRRCTAR